MTKKRIIHLDDHRLFREGLKKCMTPIMDRLEWIVCEHPDQVIAKVTVSLLNNEPIHMLITDYNHPGMNGLELAGTLKKLAARFDIRIPILMILMRLEESLLEEPAKPNPVIDKLFGKDVRVVDIIKYINQTLFSMNLGAFTDLPNDEQLVIIMEEGVPVAETEDSHSEIVLYQLYDFYASVYIRKSDETIGKFGAFDHPILLQPFLDKIDISELIKA